MGQWQQKKIKLRGIIKNGNEVTQVDYEWCRKKLREKKTRRNGQKTKLKFAEGWWLKKIIDTLVDDRSLLHFIRFYSITWKTTLGKKTQEKKVGKSNRTQKRENFIAAAYESEKTSFHSKKISG